MEPAGCFYKGKKTKSGGEKDEKLVQKWDKSPSKEETVQENSYISNKSLAIAMVIEIKAFSLKCIANELA